MKCNAVRTFLSQINDRQELIASIDPAGFDYLSSNGYVLSATKEDYDKMANDVAKLSQLTTQLDASRTEEQGADAALQQDQRKEHSFSFYFQGKDKKDELSQRIQSEMTAVSSGESHIVALENNVNELIQKKSTIDRMVPYGGEYVSLTGLGSVVLNDLNVRKYRTDDEEFSDFLGETKATYTELRTIADKATSYVALIKPRVPELNADQGTQSSSLLWSVALGLAKLQGDTTQIGERFIQALDTLKKFDSTTPNKLMAAEIITAINSDDVQSLRDTLKNLEQQVRKQGVPKELSAGVAATIMGGRRFDGTYPLDRFSQFKQLTSSFEADAILAVMNVPYDDLVAKFQTYRSMFTSWGYMTSEDTEIASAFMAIGGMNVDEAEEKLKYIVEQLRNYLEYPLVAAAILASIPVFEAHEVLDLMEKAVTLLSNYATGLERSELIALAVRMIHGVRNELVKEVDPTARVVQTPVQFTYGMYPGFFIWYFPVIIAHSSYHATFSGMGGFHPAHSHGIGGFAG
jgi:hypothetical protein